MGAAVRRCAPRHSAPRAAPLQQQGDATTNSIKTPRRAARRPQPPGGGGTRTAAAAAARCHGAAAAAQHCSPVRLPLLPTTAAGAAAAPGNARPTHHAAAAARAAGAGGAGGAPRHGCNQLHLLLSNPLCDHLAGHLHRRLQHPAGLQGRGKRLPRDLHERWVLRPAHQPAAEDGLRPHSTSPAAAPLPCPRWQTAPAAASASTETPPWRETPLLMETTRRHPARMTPALPRLSPAPRPAPPLRQPRPRRSPLLSGWVGRAHGPLMCSRVAVQAGGVGGTLQRAPQAAAVPPPWPHAAGVVEGGDRRWRVHYHLLRDSGHAVLGLLQAALQLEGGSEPQDELAVRSQQFN